MQLRLDPESILQIYEVAAEKRVRVGTMVRDWVLERLAAESTSGKPRPKPGGGS